MIPAKLPRDYTPKGGRRIAEGYAWRLSRNPDLAPPDGVAASRILPPADPLPAGLRAQSLTAWAFLFQGPPRLKLMAHVRGCMAELVADSLAERKRDAFPLPQPSPKAMIGNHNGVKTQEPSRMEGGGKESRRISE